MEYRCAPAQTRNQNESSQHTDSSNQRGLKRNPRLQMCILLTQGFLIQSHFACFSTSRYTRQLTNSTNCLNTKEYDNEREMEIRISDLRCWGRELNSPASAQELCNDDEDESKSNESCLYAEGHSSTGLSNPLCLEVGNAETTFMIR
jgi:hypothetical protein